MSSIADSALHIQTSSQSIPSPPSWFGEVTIMAHYLRRIGVLAAISERVRFGRRRFGRVRGHRLCGSADWLCHQWRTQVGRLL